MADIERKLRKKHGFHNVHAKKMTHDGKVSVKFQRTPGGGWEKGIFAIP